MIKVHKFQKNYSASRPGFENTKDLKSKQKIRTQYGNLYVVTLNVLMSYGDHILYMFLFTNNCMKVKKRTVSRRMSNDKQKPNRHDH